MQNDLNGLPRATAFDCFRQIGMIGTLIFAALLVLPSGGRAQNTPATLPAFYSFAPAPPMGWNSYDAFGDSVTEKEILANASYMKTYLLAHGWNTIIIDFRWYDPEPTGDDHVLNQKRAGAKLTADAFGRMLPAPNRFPSAEADGERGFKPLADQLHAMGLKFGFHYMRGIPRQAVYSKTPIADGKFSADEAADTNSRCSWCPDMFGVRNNDAGQAWYDAMFKLYASWGLDYIKVDDLSLPYSRSEIEQIRKAIDRSGRQIVFSTSPGPTPVRQARHIMVNANLWRISGDFWDTWSKLDQQFDLIYGWRDTGGVGHWPDADMIPFGHICIRSKAGGTDRVCRYTQDEQITLISFWSLAPSPLMLGGNLPDNTPWDLSVLTNDEVLAIDQDSLGKQATRVWRRPVGSSFIEAWLKELKDGSHVIGVFNRDAAPHDATLNWSDAHLPAKLQVRDVWLHKDLGKDMKQLVVSLPPHGSELFKLSSASQ